nr:META domain-containing protein [uncultured Flavobacterium sp.]
MKKLFTILFVGITAVLISSCKSAHASGDSEYLTEGNWVLETINGKPASEVGFANELPNAIFTTDLKINGKNGCNSYGGVYNLNVEGGMNISKVFSTKMACPGNGEKDYMDALNSVNMAKINKDKLILLKDVKEVLVFKHVTE